MISVSPTGVPNLDEILGGGLPDRTMTLILGAPGAGKTILAEQIAVHHARSGARALIFTALSESHEQLLTGLGEFTFAEPSLIGNQLRFYSVQAVLEQGLAAVTELIVETARGEHAKLVVIDGFHGITGFADRQRDISIFLYTLRSQLTLLGITVLVTYETGLNEPFDSGTLTIADGILALHNTREEERHHRWLEVSKLRGMAHLDGLHTFRITADGITCYPRQEAVYRAMAYLASEERATLGLPELDAMLGGGFNRGTSTFLAGGPGTGKTLIALHYLMAGAATGERGLYVGLAESESQLSLKARGFGLDLRGAVNAGAVSLLTISPAELDADVLATAIRDRVENGDVQRLVIDSIAMVENEISFPKRVPRYISSLLNYLREREVTSILTQESAALEGGVNPTLSSILADNILALRLIEYANRLYRILSVRKMRQSAFDPSLREFRIEHGAIRVVPAAESGGSVMQGIRMQEQREARLTRRNRRV